MREQLFSGTSEKLFFLVERKRKKKRIDLGSCYRASRNKKGIQIFFPKNFSLLLHFFPPNSVSCETGFLSFLITATISIAVTSFPFTGLVLSANAVPAKAVVRAIHLPMVNPHAVMNAIHWAVRKMVRMMAGLLCLIAAVLPQRTIVGGIYKNSKTNWKTAFKTKSVPNSNLIT